MNIVLRDLNFLDKRYFYSWIKDKEVVKYSLSIFQNMNTEEEISNWFDKLLLDNSSYNKAIIDLSNNELIGYAGICQINKTNLSGEYFIFIGNKNYHKKGIGTFVTKEIVKLGFEELGLNRIMLTVCDKNTGAIKAYTKANFKIEGNMRHAFYRDGIFCDKIIMGILKDEWLESPVNSDN